MISWLRRKKTLTGAQIPAAEEDPYTSPAAVVMELKSKAIPPDKEIEHFKHKLLQYGIELQDMPKQTPSRYKARSSALQTAYFIADHEELRDVFLKNRQLPMLSLMPAHHKKSIKRHASYIIAAALIIIEDYHYLKGYLPEQEALS
ncbi:putative RNA polymerase sigma factor SigI [Fictibacillus macauensis ZFHKF-1]|uniref:Putative RNA polymerase sigma factor SigI n=1 Tax=Fictibacillus macauensis ZFHKF-1 TaxID=1196324 RepID=I8AJC3_9BACL|nr:hypothetical protein [Fictibacillus macauensis]EIT85604.1 putative RNA polymerase sigma factor SigI [Fictibacillus macauensis ZFHKF-1]